MSASGSKPSTPKEQQVSPPDIPSIITTQSSPSTVRNSPARLTNRRAARFSSQRHSDSFPAEPDHPADPRHLSHPKGSLLYSHRNLSDASIESSSLLDHRDQQSMRPRRTSSTPMTDTQYGAISSGSAPRRGSRLARSRTTSGGPEYDSGEEQAVEDESARLLPSLTEDDRDRASSSASRRSAPGSRSGINIFGDRNRENPMSQSAYGVMGFGSSVNFPPSMPGSPSLEGRNSFFDRDVFSSRETGEHIINIDHSDHEDHSPTRPGLARHNTSRAAEADVCFPVEHDMLGDEETLQGDTRGRRSPRKHRPWPDLAVLEDWSRAEKESRSEGNRAKKTTDPMYIQGRLRPRATWHRTEEDEPYRFTYFNEDFASTIHSHTISELLAPGQTFEELFRPEPSKRDDDSDDDDISDMGAPISSLGQNGAINNGIPSETTRTSRAGSGIRLDDTSFPEETAGTRPTFWLDVLSPTDAEMRVLARTFGIHPLTAEDILMQEDREKVELFRSYYLVCYKTFEQDPNSENYLDPVNFYMIVFREGIISFHFSMVPHCANVRRRVRQLRDYINVSSDWISYALIDDITDAFQPLIQAIEEEADTIDHEILQMHTFPDSSNSPEKRTPTPPGTYPYQNPKAARSKSSLISQNQPEERDDADMLRRVGDCRKKVMGLYRLLGNKADVIKGFAKRCNERWEVAPRSEIGLYLGDIQDHIVTMVANLSHYEKILSRAFSNYLAQINLKMNERAEQTNDVLGKLTVLGTIVLPMNIITGLWGMNVIVPGQTVENLHWFVGITGCLTAFGFLCYFIAKRVYGIV
ncbi:cora-domain-containing protein [Ascobolus immersus RN42]|uniref:Cora-domain-containing protein n=1 Tax=Ascobolus immersus RN42 TaxID=1160509 RepID=A0A3N4I5C8_ASCIM|nr:cora-domain-containing protein [Ascobolus immersus RN42]